MKVAFECPFKNCVNKKIERRANRRKTVWSQPPQNLLLLFNSIFNQAWTFVSFGSSQKKIRQPKIMEFRGGTNLGRVFVHRQLHLNRWWTNTNNGAMTSRTAVSLHLKALGLHRAAVSLHFKALDLHRAAVAKLLSVFVKQQHFLIGGE